MNELSAAERYDDWQAIFEKAQPADWVRQMVDHYWRTGKSRTEDLERLLGDPLRGVEVGPNLSLASMLSARELLHR